MNLVTLEMVKRQCRVDFNDDDELLTTLAESAEEEVVMLTGRSIGELLEMGSAGVPAPIRQAILVRTAQMYADAEGTEKPCTLYMSLLRPYQRI